MFSLFSSYISRCVAKNKLHQIPVPFPPHPSFVPRKTCCAPAIFFWPSLPFPQRTLFLCRKSDAAFFRTFCPFRILAHTIPLQQQCPSAESRRRALSASVSLHLLVFQNSSVSHADHRQHPCADLPPNRAHYAALRGLCIGQSIHDNRRIFYSVLLFFHAGAGKEQLLFHFSHSFN